MPINLNILLVEDNPADAELVREALAGSAHQLEHVFDGDAALQRLQNPDHPIPDLILLDINLPKINGLEVLAVVKQDQRLLRIPVIMLTSSSAARDINASYDLHANCFISKPFSPKEFFRVVRSVEQFWSNVATLPPQ